jgi:hypothetical protein
LELAGVKKDILATRDALTGHVAKEDVVYEIFKRVMNTGVAITGALIALLLSIIGYGRQRTARGRCGSLLLHRNGLAPSTPCRSPDAHPRIGTTDSVHSPLPRQNITCIINTSLREISQCLYGRYGLSRTRATRDGRGSENLGGGHRPGAFGCLCAGHRGKA